MMDAPLEIEVKFNVSEPDLIRNRLLAMGAASSGPVFERNIRFENTSKSLKKGGMLLRLRRDDRIRLTFKSSLYRPDPQFKVHRELEVVVDDFQVCQAILESLGFHPEQIYEKWRETFVLDHTKCLIDRMPYGVFLEIEGEKALIRSVSQELGLKWEERILLNYLEIFEVIQRKEALPFADVTFDNFRGLELNVGSYLHLLYADR